MGRKEGDLGKRVWSMVEQGWGVRKEWEERERGRGKRAEIGGGGRGGVGLLFFFDGASRFLYQAQPSVF